MLKKFDITTKYLIAVIFMLLFVANDLIFDFAFTFNGSDTISFVFTVLTAIIVFGGGFSLKNKTIPKEYAKTKAFIESNFDKAQMIFSILDIICGVISIMSGVLYLSLLIKAVRIIYIPTKVLVVANKGKSLIKPITKFSYLWTSTRLLEKNGDYMIKFLKSNKRTIAVGVLLSAVVGYGIYNILPTVVALPVYANIIATILSGIGAFILVFVCGKDTVQSLALRLANKTLSEDKYNTLVETLTKLEANQKIEDENAEILKEAEKRLAKEKKEDVSVDEFEAKVQAKMEELKRNVK